ncbi:MAG: integrase [Peptococcaceae bacterium BICA1-7]|nr:MAG: integrase [Peptococcaceae bacterium BICA1-7]HBV96174.1 integrase [Desulfotomaculum sp.]
MTMETINKYFYDNELKFSKHTIKAYSNSLKEFFSFCKKEYDEVKATDIRDWLAVFINCGYKPNSIILKYYSLKSFYQYCIEEGLIKKDPTSDMLLPEKEKLIPVYLNQQELANLKNASANSPRDRAIIETLYTTGVRVSELVNIKKEDINWYNKEILICKGKAKKERFVLFTIECAERLKKYLALRIDESPYLFVNGQGYPLSVRGVNFILNKYSKILNLGYSISPHKLRHTFAARLAAKGMPLSCIQDLLGHDNIKNTIIYTRLYAQARKNKYDNFY